MLKLRVFLMGAVFAGVAIGFAAAVPHTLRLAATQASQDLEDEAASEEIQSPDGDPTEAAGDPDEQTREGRREAGGRVEGDGKPMDNHGAAVSTAAHCDLHGRDHGELVREIAQDKDATSDLAETRCAEEVAAAEQVAAEQGSAGGLVTKAHGKGHSKSDSKSDKVTGKGHDVSVSRGSQGDEEDAPVAGGGNATEDGGAGGSTKVGSPASRPHGKGKGK
jgi:hypothetical protein